MTQSVAQPILVKLDMYKTITVEKSSPITWATFFSKNAK
jgi:hypothetical protein